jgi:hypothetical protein
MKIVIYSFRHEYQLSGQFRATSQLIALFKEIGWEAEAIPSNSSSFHQRKQLNFKLFFGNGFSIDAKVTIHRLRSRQQVYLSFLRSERLSQRDESGAEGERLSPL